MQLPPVASAQHIQLKYSFGLNSSIRSNIFFQEDEKIIYPSGYNIVQSNISDQTQVYYQGLNEYRGISCIQLSPLRRWLAVGLKGMRGEEKYDPPGIAIYDTITQRKKYVLQFKEEKIKYWVSMAFPSAQQEAKYFISLSGNFLSERNKEKELKERMSGTSLAALAADKMDGEVVACYWSLSQNGKILAWVKLSQPSIEAYEISINNHDTGFFSCIGKKVFKCYKKVDFGEEGQSKISRLENHCQHMKKAPLELSQDYTCHTWLTCDNSLIVCTSNGEVILCDENAEFQQVLKHSPVKLNKQPWKIECITTYSKGFVIGGKETSIFVYQITQDPNIPFQEINRLIFKGHSDLRDLYVTGISVSPHSEEKIACTLSSNQGFAVKLKKDPLYSSENEDAFEPLTLGFHCGPINGMDVCARKPLIATCGKDKTIKLWNYEEKTLELSWTFNEEIFCLALHPSGLHMVVCLNDKLRCLNICLHQSSNSNKVKHYKEIVQFRQCREVKFSNGGQYFAAINGTQSSQLIMIFRFYTGEQPPHLVFKGHTGRVKSLVWSRDDTLLASCGVDGMVYIWRIDGDSPDPRLYENSQKGVSLSCLALNMDQEMIFSCGNDKFLHQGYIYDSQSLSNKFNQEVSLSQLAFTSTNKILFGGIQDEYNSSGAIRCILFTNPTNPKFYDFPAHDEQGVEKIRITQDDRYLISAGKDGSIMIFEIKDKDARGMRIKEGYQENAGEILVTRLDLDDLKNIIDNYGSLLEEFSSSALNSQTTQQEEQIKLMQDKLVKSFQRNKISYEQLQEKKREIENKYDQEIKAMKEKFEMEISELDTSYQRKVMDEAEKYESSRKTYDGYRNNNYRDKQTKDNFFQTELKGVDDEYGERLQIEVNQRERVRSEIEAMMKDNQEIYSQIENETKEEINSLQSKNWVSEAEVKEKNKKAKSDAAITLKKIEQKKRDSEQYDEQYKMYQKQLKKLKEDNDLLSKDIQQQKEQISERDKTIGKQEKQIYKQKKKSQNLEKFKFVLDHKIKELKRDIGPRENEITRMKDETNQMDQMLKRYNSYNNHLGNAVDELYTAQELMNTEIKDQRQSISSSNSKIKRFKDDLYKTVQFIQDYPELKDCVNQMKLSFANKTIEKSKNDEQIQQEYNNQKLHLQNKVNKLKKYLKQDNQIHKDYNLGLMSSNVSLIKEINILRKQIKDIQKGEGPITSKPAYQDNKLQITRQQRSKTAHVKSLASEDEGNLQDDPELREKERILANQAEAISEMRIILEELREQSLALINNSNKNL